MLTKVGALLVFSDDLHQLYKDLDRFWSFEDDEKIKEKCSKELNLIHKLGKVYLYCCFVAIPLYILLPFISPKDLPIYCYVPESLSLKQVWFMQTLFIPLASIGFYSYDYIITTFLQLTVMQFKILNSTVSKLRFDEVNDQVLRNQFGKFINHHKFLLNYAERLKIIMSIPVFIQFFTATSGICIEMYLIKTRYTSII